MESTVDKIAMGSNLHPWCFTYFPTALGRTDGRGC